MATRHLFRSISLMVFLNLLLKPVWIFAIDRNVQLVTGQEAYGSYFSLLQFSLLFSFVLDAGIGTYFTVSYTRQTSLIQLRDFQTLFYLKLLLCLLYTVVLFSVAFAMKLEINSVFLYLILYQLVNFLLLFARSYFVTNQLFHTDAFVSVADKFAATVILGAMLLFSPAAISISNFLLIQILCSAVLLLICLLRILYRKQHLRRGFSGLPDLFKKALPYALLIFLMGILLRGDTVLLKLWSTGGNSEVAQYAYGYRFTDGFNSFCFLVAGFLFPFFCKHLPDKKRIRNTVHTSIFLLAAISISAALVFLVFKKELTQWIYHTGSEAIQSILLYCVFSFIGLSMVHVYGSLLTASRKIKPLLITTGIFCCLSAIGNYFFIPRYGAVATALICCFVQFLYGSTLALLCYKNSIGRYPIKQGNT